jgi:transposase
MRKHYPSDITRKQFEMIRPILEAAKKTTRPRTIDLYDIFCAVAYFLRSSCGWRMLPGDFPKWRTVYTYWEIWTAEIGGEPSVWEKVLKKIKGRGTRWEWAQEENILRHSRRAEC